MKSKIRVLQFPIANSNGGITHYALNNWQWMDKSQFSCDFVTMSAQLTFEDDILSSGSKVYHISCYAEEDRQQFIKEFRSILEQGYDVVHLHTKQWKSFLIEDICREYHIPKVIVHAHNTAIDGVDKDKREYELCLHEKIKAEFNENLATDFWACSKLAADFLFGKQIPESKIAVMPNAIELDRFSFDQTVRSQYRKEYGLENCFVIGNAARFEYQKNHEFLIDLFYEISLEIDNARLVLLGDGCLFEEIQEKVRNLNLENKVLFVGRRDDVDHWYQAMDVFCLPSRFEGLPIALVEAQASGLLCAASDTITDEAAICDHVWMLPLKPEVWRDKILRLHQDQVHKHRKSQAERNIIDLQKAGYDIQIQIKCIEEEYRRLRKECRSE